MERHSQPEQNKLHTNIKQQKKYRRRNKETQRQRNREENQIQNPEKKKKNGIIITIGT